MAFTPYVIPHSAGMKPNLIAALTKSHSQVIRLKGQIIASKAVGAYVSMKAAKTGKPLTLLTPIAIQQRMLSGASRQASVVGSGYLKKTARTDILTDKVTGLFADVRALKQELRDRPEVTKIKPFWDLGIKKEHLILAAAAIGGIILLPHLLSGFKK